MAEAATGLCYMADSFMMSIVAHRLPCRKGGASGHPPSLADERQSARDLYGHGSTVQSRDLRCLTGFVVLAGVALGALGADVVVGVGDAITAAGAIGVVTMAACGAAVTAAILALTVAGVGVGVVGTCGTGPGAGSFPSRRRAVTRHHCCCRSLKGCMSVVSTNISRFLMRCI